MATTTQAGPGTTTGGGRSPFLVELYRSALGKKYIMAITGIVGLGYILAHMIGNLKLYQSPEDFNRYAEFLRELLYPIAPQSAVLNLLRRADPRPDRARGRRRAAHRDEPAGPAGQLPLEAGLRRRGLRGAHDALDRRDRAAVPRLPPRRPDLGLGQPAPDAGATSTRR
jgi:hypothetical protein